MNAIHISRISWFEFDTAYIQHDIVNLILQYDKTIIDVPYFSPLVPDLDT